jgi:hypothetical protein
MSVPLTGAPKTVVDVNDVTNLVATAIGGIICVQGETLRGEVGKAVFVGSAGQFKRLLGGLHPASPFPTYCLRLLNAGAKLWVSRAGHYTDPTDASTLVGTAATGSLGPSNAPTLTFAAKFIGAGYNGTTVTIQAPASFQAGVFDVLVKLPGSDQVQSLRNIAATPTAAQLTALNQQLDQVKMVSGTLSLGTITLAGGAQDVTAIVAEDYNGDRQAGTGWYAFSNVTDAFRIANLHRPDPLIDDALKQYVIDRGDMRFHLGMPLGANAQGLEDYRMGTGVYDHTPIDTWLGSYWGVNTIGNDGAALTVDIDIPAVVETVACMAAKDSNFGPWYAVAGPKRGRVRTFNKGVPYNLISPDLSADFDRIYLRGVNAVVQDPTYGAMVYGNRSALLDNTKLLSKENVADLMMYLIRTLRPIMRSEQFEPNNPRMWKSIYRKILPIMEDLERREAIVPGEGVGWVWLGDQDATTREDATYNTQADLTAGIFRAGLIAQPIAATEYINLSLTAADSNSISYAVSQGATLSSTL